MIGKQQRIRFLIGALVLGGSALGLSACGSSGDNALGHQACVAVASSIKLYNEAEHADNAATANKDHAAALTKLRAALRPASIAGTEDGDWQALMTTLEESSRVSEKLLIPALSAQCAQTLQNNS